MNYIKTRRDTIRKLRVPFAVYANIAVTAVEQFLGFERTSELKDPIDQILQKNLKDEDKIRYWTILKKNVDVAGKLLEDNLWLQHENREDHEKLAIENFDKFRLLLELLRDIRNYWSHLKHKEPVVTNESLQELIIRIYNTATTIASRNTPPRYAGKRGVFCFKSSDRGKITFNLPDNKELVGDFTDHLTFTGHVFIISLFLRQHEVSELLNALEQAPYSFDQIKQRQEWREQHPDEEYPEELRTEKKHFFYARDVYTLYAIKGHRDTWTMDEESRHKEKAFALLEYLKRCPSERLVNHVAKNKQTEIGSTINTGVTEVQKESSDRYLMPHHMVNIEGQNYALREKNKFFEYVVDFLHEEWEFLKLTNHTVFEWKWARHAPASLVKDLKDDWSKSDPLTKLPRHKKIIWDIPQKEVHQINDRQEEYGYPWYYEKDKNGQYSHALFKLTHKGKEQTIIGRLSSEVLCTILENYFSRFPIMKQDENTEKTEVYKKRRKFFEELFKNLLDQIITKTDGGRGQKQKARISKEVIAKRITYLRQTWTEEEKSIEANDQLITVDPFSASKLHDKIIYIAQTWSKMITFGQSNNLAHAKDYKGITGGKNGYLEIIKYLSLMTDQSEYKRNQANENLIKTLKKLGNRNGVSYHQAIKEQLKYTGSKDAKFPLNNKSLHQLFTQARNYRLALLNKMEQDLQTPFDDALWRPQYEMRWLGLRDDRTSQASQNQQKAPHFKETGIYNVDHHYYAAVGIQGKALKAIQAGLEEKVDEKAKLTSCHTRVLKPNGNNLVIQSFFQFEGWEHWPRTSRQRLYAIKRQDAVLAQLAYHYTLKYEDPYSNRTLDSLDFQKDVLKLPVAINTVDGPTHAFITCYYRHFKQNRYRILPRQLRKLMNILTDHELLPGHTIALNHLMRKPKKDLTREEKGQLLSKEEQTMRDYEKMQLAEKRVAMIKEEMVLVPIPEKERQRFYLTELLTGYQLCRMAFLPKLFTLEQRMIDNYELKPNDRGFVAFEKITEKLKKEQLMTEETIYQLDQLRNCALHNDIPTGQLLPKANQLVQRVADADKQRTGPEYIDFFGKGMLIVTDLLNKVPRATVKPSRMKK